MRGRSGGGCRWVGGYNFMLWKVFWAADATLLPTVSTSPPAAFQLWLKPFHHAWQTGWAPSPSCGQANALGCKLLNFLHQIPQKVAHAVISDALPYFIHTAKQGQRLFLYSPCSYAATNPFFLNIHEKSIKNSWKIRLGEKKMLFICICSKADKWSQHRLGRL